MYTNSGTSKDPDSLYILTPMSGLGFLRSGIVFKLSGIKQVHYMVTVRAQHWREANIFSSVFVREHKAQLP